MNRTLPPDKTVAAWRHAVPAVATDLLSLNALNSLMLSCRSRPLTGLASSARRPKL